MAMGSLGTGHVTDPPASQTAQTSEDEVAASDWEYEYDENETEDFYFTLDLTSNGAPLKKPSRGRINIKTTSAAKRVANDKGGSATPSGLDTEEDSTAHEAGELQLLDLHTANPIVKLNDDVYSCSWSTDLGTQFYVSRPGVTNHALRPGNVLDVIGVSQVRLLGEPVTLQLRDGQGSSTVEGTSATNAVEIDDDAPRETDPTPIPSDFSTMRPGEPLIIPRDLYPDKDVEAQASFFERLSAIKLKKGETDVIPITGVKFYEPPANKNDIRVRALAAELMEEGMRKTLENPPEPPQQPKRKRQKGPRQEWNKRSYADLGKETKADRLLRLARASETPGPPTLLLPRSQQSITATADQPVAPQLPYWAYPTVRYDAPGWDAASIEREATGHGIDRSGAFNGDFERTQEAVGMSSAASGQSAWPYGPDGASRWGVQPAENDTVMSGGHDSGTFGGAFAQSTEAARVSSTASESLLPHASAGAEAHTDEERTEASQAQDGGYSSHPPPNADSG